ncbi:hypothetical protein AHAS_Ahas18G0040000 [Arachis hypogaea]
MNGYDELSERKGEKAGSEGFDFLHLMEEHSLRANSQTFLWLLKGCIKCGSFSDGLKLHGKILKMDFYSEQELCDWLINLYIKFGDLKGVVKLFEDMRVRPLSCWNIIHRFIVEKFNCHVLSLFLQMMKEEVKPDEKTYAGFFF